MAKQVDRAVRDLPLFTRAHVLDEAARDPRFWDYFAPLALSSNPRAAVDMAMQRAVANAIDPFAYPEMRGQWPVLRERFANALAIMQARARREAIPGPHEPGYLMSLEDARGLGMAPIIEALTEAYAVVMRERTGRVPMDGLSGDMGFISTVISAISALAPVAIQTYTAKRQADIASHQAKKAAAAEQAAIKGSVGPPPAPLPGAGAPAAETPSWLKYALYGAAAVAGVFLLKAVL